MLRVRWPVTAIATRSGTPARTMFLSEISHAFTVAVEHQRGHSHVAVFLEQPGLPATINQLGKITFQHYSATPAGLGRFGAKPHRPGVPVHVGPLQGDDLALPPAREVGEPGEVPQVGG